MHNADINTFAKKLQWYCCGVQVVYMISPIPDVVSYHRWFTVCQHGSILIIVICFRSSICVLRTCMSLYLSAVYATGKTIVRLECMVCLISTASTLPQKSLLKDFLEPSDAGALQRSKETKSKPAQIVISNSLVLSCHVHCKNAFCLQLWFEFVEHELPPHVGSENDPFHQTNVRLIPVNVTVTGV